MNKGTRFSPDAAWELEDAARRVDRARPGWGDKLYGEVFDAIDHCQQWPTDPEYRQAIVDVFPYVVFYRIDEARRTLVIVAIAHTRREPGYWKTRLEP